MADSKAKTLRFEDMKKAELLSLCRDFGITMSERAKKEQIIKALRTRTEEAAEESGNGKAEKGRGGSGKKLTGKQKGAIAQKKLRAEKLETASDIYGDDDALMHSMDRMLPRVHSYRPKIHRANPEDSWKEDAKVSDEIRELAQSKSDPFFTLTGVVEGNGNTEHITDPDGNDVAFVYVRVLYKDVTVRIPSYHIWEDYQDRKKYPPEKLYSIWEHRVDSPIDFNVLLATDDDPVRYYGTCRLARKKARCDTWYATTNDGKWLIRDGDIAEARIVELWDKKIIVEIGGAESAPIFLKEITKRRIKDIEQQTSYKVGQTVLVEVSDIKREKLPLNTSGFSYPVSFRASIRAAEEDPQKKYFYDYDIGDTMKAFVTGIDTNFSRDSDNNAYYCEMEKRPVVVKCTATPGLGQSGYLPREDDCVRIRIIKKDEDLHRLYGEIIRKEVVKKENEVAFVINR